MRSRFSIKGHPVHPMLIPFPIAFFVGALVFDVAGVVLGSAALWTTGGHLVIAGIVMALLAAVPGVVDYFGVVPPQSSGKQRATLHGAVNLGAVVAFALAWAWRGAPAAEPGIITLGLQLIGVGLVSAGGWMGGTLVFRNQIGVDHRYAEAGKWREQTIEERREDALVVARADELETDQLKLLHVDGRRIVLARTEAGYVAFDDACPHRGASLADGAMMRGVVQCPWHGSQFDVNDGSLCAGPAGRGIRTHDVRVAGDDVVLTVHPETDD